MESIANILVTALPTILGAVIALLGVNLSVRSQLRNAREDRIFKIDEWKRAIQENEKNLEKQRLLEIHKILSIIEREFSITSLDIDWRKPLSAMEYDEKYFELCSKLDDIRAVSDLFFPELSENLNEIYGEMNIYWGYFKNLLEMEDSTYCKSKESIHHLTIEASQRIGRQCFNLKLLIRKLISTKYGAN